MLCTYTPTSIFHQLKYKGVDHRWEAVLQIHIVIAWDAHIQMHVAISNMPIASHVNGLLFLAREDCRGIDMCFGFFDDWIEVLRCEAEIIFKCLVLIIT